MPSCGLGREPDMITEKGGTSPVITAPVRRSTIGVVEVR